MSAQAPATSSQDRPAGASEPGAPATGSQVHLAVAVGVAALVAAAGLLGLVVWGRHLWWGVPLALVALGLSVYAVLRGIRGVIRYGLFTEGCGAGEMAGELRRSKIAWTAGVLGEIGLLLTLVLCVALAVRAVA
jgi:hypothetical protein